MFFFFSCVNLKARDSGCTSMHNDCSIKGTLVKNTLYAKVLTLFLILFLSMNPSVTRVCDLCVPRPPSGSAEWSQCVPE